MTHEVEDTDFSELEQVEPFQISNEECRQITDGVSQHKSGSEKQSGFKA